MSDQLRSEFRTAYAKAQAGDGNVLKTHRSKLEQYPLWPDLQAASYRARLSRTSDTTLKQFVALHPDKSSVINLRYQWAKSLAKRGQWKEYLDVYNKYYAEDEDETLRCYYTRAQQIEHPSKATNELALNLWMSGSSLPDACDPVFATLKGNNLITTKLLRNRIDLALEARNIKLAQYLAKSAHKKDVTRVNQWASMRHNPLATLAKSKKIRDNEANRERLFYGLARAARRDPQATYKIWPAFRDRYRFTTEQKNTMEKNIALSAARDHLPIALQWLSLVPVHTEESASWYARRALTQRNWPAVKHAITSMPAEAQNEDIWQYWHARAVEAMGQSDDAKQIYQQVATKRSYYGFLAADRIEVPYAFNHQVLEQNEPIIQLLRTDPRLIRAHELLQVGQHGLARSEWNRVIKTLDREHKRQAAVLAGQWNWHSRAINTMANAGGNDIMIGYPAPHKKIFDEASSRAGIDRTWAYGVARTESLFMPDVRSSANAYGLMQIIPSTGRLAAKTAHINYRGRATLLDPTTNIKLGTHYLGQIYHRFGNNQVLATAAYNAGPHRVKTWLPDDTWQADIWIENIPFKETRRYVKKVFAAQAITHWRLTGSEQRLASMMAPILNNPGAANRFASN